MGNKDGTTIEENEQYKFVLAENKATLIFSWNHIEGLSAESFRAGIAGFAAQCKAHKPQRAVIDAAALDQGSPAVAWLRGQDADTGKEDYMTWWAREIRPLLNEAGIGSLAVGTGDPNAPGELPEVPPGVNFKIGYFPTLESAMQWKVE